MGELSWCELSRVGSMSVTESVLQSLLDINLLPSVCVNSVGVGSAVTQQRLNPILTTADPLRSSRKQKRGSGAAPFQAAESSGAGRRNPNAGGRTVATERPSEQQKETEERGRGDRTQPGRCKRQRSSRLPTEQKRKSGV